MSEDIDKTGEDTDGSQGKPDLDRRKFLKIGIAGAGAAAAVAGGAVVLSKLEGTPQEDIRPPDEIAEDFKPVDQRNVVLTFAVSKKLGQKYPNRSEDYNRMMLQENPNHQEFNFQKSLKTFGKRPPTDEPGYTQVDKALAVATWVPSKYMAPGQEVARPDSGILTWEQKHLVDTKHQFSSRQEAGDSIKTAARLFGAYSCGFARRDRRWDYDPIYDPFAEKELSWEEDFPFKPKSVIVLLYEMDYHGIATAPAWSEKGAVGEGYTNVVKGAAQMAAFIQSLGYQAVGTCNDLGNNVAYGIMAGLGEGARNGSLIAPKVGCRLRIGKVYTDFDFLEYGQPRDFGVLSFCRHCKRCADSCPSNAITMDDEPSMSPTYSEDPEYTWNNQKGITKFYNDAKRCFNFWIQNDGDCGICIAACPYNKPDFWHHRLVDATNVISPGWVHSIMREMDIVFGYGKVSDPEKVKRFWKTGRKI